MTALIEVRNLKKSFRGVTLLGIESFSIEPGECIVLSGRNGSGKSTLLRILSGLIPPDSGEFTYRGTRMNWRIARRQLQQNVIYLHQHPYMLDRSVRENVAYGLRRAGASHKDIDAKVDSALNWAGLLPLAGRNARTLSGGEKQRVALTRARVLSPKLLLLDEPVANMDMESREQTIGLVRRLRDEGISTIVTTHEPRIAQLIGDRQRHLCMTGPAKSSIVQPFLYQSDTTDRTSPKESARGNMQHSSTEGKNGRGKDSVTDARKEITAVILAGGKARRMGGEDKGLVDLDGKPMIEYVIEAVQPQVGTLTINANRNLERYESFGFPVVSDMMGDYFGPLVGMASAMQIADTRYLLTVPCDSPLLREDLVGRLYTAIKNEDAELSVAHDGERMQPVFALLRTELLPSLLAYLEAGGRKIDTWYNQHKVALADFSMFPDMFLNINTPEDQAALSRKLKRVNA